MAVVMNLPEDIKIDEIEIQPIVSLNFTPISIEFRTSDFVPEGKILIVRDDPFARLMKATNDEITRAMTIGYLANMRTYELTSTLTFDVHPGTLTMGSMAAYAPLVMSTVIDGSMSHAYTVAEPSEEEVRRRGFKGGRSSYKGFMAIKRRRAGLADGAGFTSGVRLRKKRLM